MSDWKISLKTLLVGAAFIVISLWQNNWKPTPDMARESLYIVVMGQMPTAARKMTGRADDK